MSNDYLLIDNHDFWGLHKFVRHQLPSTERTHLYRGSMAVVSVYTDKLLELAPQAGGFQVSSYGNRKQRDFSFLFLQWRNDSVVITSDFTLSSGRLNCPEVLLAGFCSSPGDSALDTASNWQFISIAHLPSYSVSVPTFQLTFAALVQ